MKKIASFLIALSLIACITISCSSDDSGDNENEKAAAEQMEKFEKGWWWIYETRRYVDYNNNNEERFSYTLYLVNYDTDGRWSGECFGEHSCSEDFILDPEESVRQEPIDDEYEESWFPVMNYKNVCQYLKKEFGRPDKTDGYMYYTYKLQKALPTDNYFPDWAK